MRNLEEVRKFMYSDHIISEEEHQRWISSLKSKADILAMAVMFNENLIGVVSLSKINRTHKTADWAFYLDDKLQGKGFGGIIEYKLIEMAFNDLGIEKLNCEVLETNPTVIKLHKKFGFLEEGIRRKNIVKQNRRIDVYELGLLKEEWNIIKPKLQRILKRIVL